MFSHAHVSRKLSRRRSSKNSTSSANFLDLRKNPASGPSSILSQALTVEDTADAAQAISCSPIIQNYKDNCQGIYFTSLSDLESWYADSYGLTSYHYDRFRVPREDLSLYKRQRKSLVGQPSIRLSVCHDFKGNYLKNEDLDPQGYFPHPTGIHYFLQFPSLVSDFIYFSHNLISVPTVSWINNCHKFGIACLGTIIVEGNSPEKFRQLTQLCARDQKGEFVFVKMLVKLVEHYRFDGYLVNIESKFLNHADSFEIINFVDQLKVSLHGVSSSAKLIWYDAFIPSINKVKYENGVAPLNYQLFKSSDYFFTNYWWDEDTLKKNVAIAGLHGVNSSLYVGIDMWGRGSKIGNGGYDAPLAINFCRAYDSNVGLFAPAWTYEYLGTDNFLENDRKLWKFDGENETIASHVSEFSAACYYPFTGSLSKRHSFIFYTNFSNGQGKLFCIAGKNVFSNEWVNSNFQFEVPSLVFTDSNEYKIFKFSIDDGEAYSGGSSLKVTKNNSQVIINDGDSLKEELFKSYDLFKFETDCRCENIRLKLNYKYRIVNKDYCGYDKESFSGSIGDSKQSLYDTIEGHFQLELKYSIEKRYKSVHKVSDGKLVIPLDIDRRDDPLNPLHIETNWKSLDMTFPTPKGVKWEYCVLDSVGISWVSNRTSINKEEDKMFSYIYKVAKNVDSTSSSIMDGKYDSLAEESEELASEDNEEWIIIPDNSEPANFTELFIGDLSVVAILDEDISSILSEQNKIKGLDEVKIITKGQTFVKWIDFTNNITKPLYWSVFINNEFVGVSYFNSWLIETKDLPNLKSKSVTLRIDTVNRIGETIRGDDINLKV